MAKSSRTRSKKPGAAKLSRAPPKKAGGGAKPSRTLPKKPRGGKPGSASTC